MSDHTGGRLILKVETANPLRSFKGRGAACYIARLGETGDDLPLVCASTGNFGQAMAFACRAENRDLVVYADENANPLKVGRIRSLGADVRLEGGDFDSAKELARSHAARIEGHMVEDGLEPAISEGAGTIGVELSRLELDAVVLAVGNGALINGAARWLGAAKPDVEVIGVCARGADSMAASFHSGEIVTRERADTIAEGVAVRVPIPEAVGDMRGLVDDVVLVEDHDLIRAMQLVFEATGLVIEPAGVAGVAAVCDAPDRFAGRRIATVLTGANVTSEQARRWLYA